MRILLDECLPRQFRKLLPEHVVVTVGEAGWAGFENGELAEQAQSSFDVILTADKRFAEGAARHKLQIAIVILRAETNKLESLEPLITDLRKVLERIKPDEVVVLTSSGQ